MIGTPLSQYATRLLLLGAGELGKEVAIEAQRFGVEVIAVDRYANAPAMQVAHRSHVVNMLDGAALDGIIAREAPALVVPEIEAIATDVLTRVEQAGTRVIPNARATQLTMNREGIRRLAAEQLRLPTSAYRFADDEAQVREAAAMLGYPCIIKPVMSSSGKGQSVVNSKDDLGAAWRHSQSAGRAGGGRVIVEGFIDFDYEITLLTIRQGGGTSFCEPIGHRQVEGDYRESWQPHPMRPQVLERARQAAEAVTGALGGHGLFGVELFIKGEEVFFSEVSPRPHDTGMVTMISQDLSQFALHVRAILGLPIPAIRQRGAAASCVILGEGVSESMRYQGLDRALQEPDTAVRLFGKPSMSGKRRLGVALALGDDIGQARDKAGRAARSITVLA